MSLQPTVKVKKKEPVDPVALPLDVPFRKYPLPEFGVSSLQKAQSIALDPKFSKPTLESPEPVWNTLKKLQSLETAFNQYSLGKEQKVENMLNKIKELAQEEYTKIQEAIEASDQMTLWGLLEDFTNSVVSSVSLFFGFSALYYGNPVIGGLLISSGALALSNIAFKQANLWNLVAEQLAGNDQQLQAALVKYLPAAFGIFAAAAGLYGTYYSFGYAAAIPNRTLFIIQSTSGIASGLAALASGQASSHFTWAKGETFALQSKSELLTLDLENSVQELKRFHKKLEEIQEWVAKLVQETDRAIQSIQQPV